MSPVTPSGFTLTDHARRTMARRRVTVEDVRRVLTGATVTEPTEQGRRRYVLGDLAVVVAPGSYRAPGSVAVVTVLKRTGDVWTDDDVANRTATRQEISA